MNKDFSLPTPAALAKKEKETLKSVSLRIKQDSYDIFDVLAKREKSSANAMMTNLLDYYAQHYREEQGTGGNEGTLAIDMMQSYLKKSVENLLKMDDDARLLKLMATSMVDRILVDGGEADPAGLKDCLDVLTETGKADFVAPTAIFGDICGYYGFDLTPVGREKKPEFIRGDHIPGDINEDFADVPVEKWTLGATILALYQDRAKELRPELQAIFVEKMAKEIFEAGVKYTKEADYAWKLVDILMAFWRGQNE